jgi:hypothetical protein
MSRKLSLVAFAASAKPVLVIEIGQLKVDLIDDRLSVDAGQPAEQLRVIVNQRDEPVLDRLEVRLDQRQVIGVDPAERPGLSVVEYRSELGECSVRRVGIERRGQFGRREVEPGIAVLDTQRLKNGIVLYGVDDVQTRGAQSSFGAGVIVHRSRHAGDGGRDVREHLVDMGELVAAEIARRDVRAQSCLNQLKILDVSSIGPGPLVPYGNGVVPKPAFENPGRVIEHVFEVEIARIKVLGSHSSPSL